jgi:CRISPR system Cascade subunit CasB
VAENQEKRDKPTAFVEYIIKKIVGRAPGGSPPDTAFRAAMRKADNPDTAPQSWEYLAGWCDLEKPERKPFALIGAAVAKAGIDADGSLGIGAALARCYADGDTNGSEKDGAKLKLRRLLACSTVAEACDMLKPLLSLIRSREVHVNYAGLLKDLLVSDDYFNDRIKPRWAQNFYRKEAVFSDSGDEV